MKKTLTILTLIAMLIAGLFLMTGCGDEESSSSKSKKSKKDDDTSYVADKDDDDDDKDSKSSKYDDDDDDDDKDSKSSKEDKDDDDDKDSKNDKDEDKDDDDSKETTTIDTTKKIDLEDSSSYYFVVKGVKYTAGDKISKLVDNGFTQSKTGAEKEIPANGYLIGGGAILNSDSKTVFDVTPVNTTKEKIKGADGQIGSFSIDKSQAEKLSGKVEIFGGITIGTSIKDVEAIFGEPSTKTDATEYNGPTYTYNAKASYRNFTFRFDKDGKLNSIRWQNYTFNK